MMLADTEHIDRSQTGACVIGRVARCLMIQQSNVQGPGLHTNRMASQQPNLLTLHSIPCFGFDFFNHARLFASVINLIIIIIMLK